MGKFALRCDVCNGSLTMQPGGELAICDYCGTKYALPRLREKIQEIRGTVSVAGVVKTTSADFDIQAGVLLHYRGRDTEIVIPDDVQEIGRECFKGMQYLTSVTFPKGLKRIADAAFMNCTGLTHISFPEGLVLIGQRAFEGCYGLTHITFSEGLASIEKSAFFGCYGLTHITFPERMPKLASNSFYYCQKLKVVEPESDYGYTIGSFYSRPVSPWVKSYYIRHGKCAYCGGEFKEVFLNRCSRCGKEKDY